MQQQGTDVPTSGHLELALLEGDGLAILELGLLASVENLHHLGALLDESFVIDDEVVEGLAVSACVLGQGVALDLDVGHVHFGVSHVVPVVVEWTLPGIVLVMLLALLLGAFLAL